MGHGMGGGEGCRGPAVSGRNYPECLENLRALDEHEEAAHEAAVLGDREGYLEALRGYMRAGRENALRMRRGRREAS